MGDNCVGKSSVILQLNEKKFKASTHITIGVETSSKIIEVDSGVNVKVVIFDTAAQNPIMRSYYRGAICFILVYDITQKKSFSNIVNWLKEV